MAEAEVAVGRSPGTSTAGARAGVTGTLFVVATPIGNLGDISLRAIEVLRTVAVVAAEDTRLTRRLWARHDITTHLVSYHAQSSDRRTEELLGRLRAGDDVALVTDAGTPLVSDPGGELVSAWAGAGGLVVPVPGPSAVLAALVASAIATPRWAFEGFLPRRGRERRERIARIASDDRATVLFESPGRTAATLRDLATACGSARLGALCRELTKLHEQTRRGTLEELAVGAVADPPRGEVTIVVSGTSDRPGGEAAMPMGLDVARGQVARLVADGHTRSRAAKEVARMTGLPRRDLFDEPSEGM